MNAGIKISPSVMRQSGLFASAMVQRPPMHQSARPAGVQPVEPFRLVRVEHRGDDRIGVGFHAAVAQAENDAAPIKQLVAVLLRGGQARRPSRHESTDRP